MTLLSKPAILRHLEAGSILIDPFDPANLGPNSYDVCLGPHCWREGSTHVFPQRTPLYNPYDKNHVEKLWIKDEAKPLGELFDFDFIRNHIDGINQDDFVILVKPGESILAHTQEFIGGMGNNITTVMHARSSIGRNFLEVCRCSGQGDVNFHSIWALEIQSNSRFHTIPIVVGRRIAQIMFFEVEPVEQDDNYVNKGGKYQQESSIEKLKISWKPEDLLPKLYMDREVNSDFTEHQHFDRDAVSDGCFPIHNGPDGSVYKKE